MSIFTYDTEFLEDGRTIDLISIGMVDCFTGNEYYAINVHAPWARIEHHDWLMDNVVPSLEPAVRIVEDKLHPMGRHIEIQPEHEWMKASSGIARDLYQFVSLGMIAQGQVLGDHTPELWAYYADYDHVALAQLWGRMLDLPRGFPMLTMDIKQEKIRQEQRLGKSLAWPEQKAGHHNALDDAKHNLIKMRSLGIVP